jgi:hypothetical protein
MLLERHTDGYGQRYYEPEFGLWMDRDLIENKKDTNLYGFIGNNPIDRSDYLGMWRIIVEKNTAGLEITNAYRIVVADSDGDTVTALVTLLGTKGLHLDTADALKVSVPPPGTTTPGDVIGWLRFDKDETKAPGSESQIVKGCKYRVPNRVLLTHGNGMGIASTATKARTMAAPFLTDLKTKGFLVEERTDTVEDDPGNISLIMGYPIAVWVHEGHGLVAGSLNFTGYSTGRTATDFKPDYKLSSIYLISCYAAKQATQWKTLVASGGSMYGTDAAITVTSTSSQITAH